MRWAQSIMVREILMSYLMGGVKVEGKEEVGAPRLSSSRKEAASRRSLLAQVPSAAAEAPAAGGGEETSGGGRGA